MTVIHLGISTCPNDTFAFHAILNRAIDLRGLEFRIELLDVQELNQRLSQGDFDVAKASFFAALQLSHKLGVFRSGSALGFGVGPLLLAARPTGPPSEPWTDARGNVRPCRVLCPGQATTAHLLYRLFYNSGQIEHAVFSDIMPELQVGTADYGVCIHEGRFTWREQGLACVADLGERWEQATQTPLPLGGILGRLTLADDVLQTIQEVIHASVCYGLEHREETKPTMRRYAQEFNDEVLMAHVDLYVNQWTVDLGETGERALSQLRTSAQEVGLIERQQPALQVLGHCQP